MESEDRPLRLATVFSGIGAIEHALERMGLDHEIVFACDSGGIDILEDRTDSEEEAEQLRERIESIENPEEKKQFVDQLFEESRKTNFVEQSFLENYDVDEDRFYRDVRFLDGEPYRNSVDLYVGGSPCQSFSFVGDQAGFEDTRGTLFYDFIRLIREIRPSVFIFENVKGVLTHDGGKTWRVMANVFDELDYHWYHDVLNAKDYGIPQNRQRLFVVGLRYDRPFFFPEEQPLEKTMQDFLQDNVSERYYLPPKGVKFVTDEKNIRKQYTQIDGDIALCQKANQQFNWHGDFVRVHENGDGTDIPEKYFLSDKVADYVLASGTKNFYSKPEINLDIARPLLKTMHKMHRAGVDNYVTTDGDIRKLTPRECLRLMGFCDSFEQVVSDTQMYRQAGNSIVVDVLIALVSRLFRHNCFQPNNGSVDDEVLEAAYEAEKKRRTDTLPESQLSLGV